MCTYIFVDEKLLLFIFVFIKRKSVAISKSRRTCCRYPHDRKHARNTSYLTRIFMLHVNQKIRLEWRENARSHFLCVSRRSKTRAGARVALHKSSLAPKRTVYREYFFTTYHAYVYTQGGYGLSSPVKRVVLIETRVSLKRWDISVLACGRRTERGDKEGDKCECRPGTRAKRIYGITRQETERKRKREKEREGRRERTSDSLLWRLGKRAKKIAADIKQN